MKLTQRSISLICPDDVFPGSDSHFFKTLNASIFLLFGFVPSQGGDIYPQVNAEVLLGSGHLASF